MAVVILGDRFIGQKNGEVEMKLKGTKTEKKLLAAFAGESQARNRYTFFASAAKKEGYEQIASIFLKPQRTRRNMPSGSSHSSKAAW